MVQAKKPKAKLKAPKAPVPKKPEVEEEAKLGEDAPADETTEDAPADEERITDEKKTDLPVDNFEANFPDGDYLRQYQYKKQAKFGTKETDPAAGSKAARMKEKLLAQPRIRMMIPREFQEDTRIPKSVCLNGYRLDFPKQTYVDVPEQVAEILMTHLNQTEQAILRGQIGEDKAKQDALT